MFDIVKKEVSLLEVLAKDLDVEFKAVGEKNWGIAGESGEHGCPFCGHHDCFRVHQVLGENSSGFYKCFSCSETGDVIKWRSVRKNIEPAEAARELAAEFSVTLPDRKTALNPLQQIFDMAAEYYHARLGDTGSQSLLGGRTPMQYLTEVRKRKPEIIKTFKVGYSDGGLVPYLSSMGFEDELIKTSGLMNSKGTGDFLPKNCFIYPHMVMGRVSHFTFKDPLKRKQYQLAKKYSLNGHTFYGQDNVKNSRTIALVEGENDLLAVYEAGGTSTLATIGQLSGEQLDWLVKNYKDRRIITLFDPDDAGDLYREKVEILRGHFADIIHILPPNGKDIDELLVEGMDFAEILKSNRVIVKVRDKLTKQNKIAPWDSLDGTQEEQGEGENDSKDVVEAPGVLTESDKPVRTTLTPQEFTPPAELSRPSLSLPPTRDDSVVQIEDSSVLIMRGCYYKVTVKDGTPSYSRISNFTLELKNIYLDEDTGDRKREIVVHRYDGFKSRPFELDSETKVSIVRFKSLMAKVADAEWSGREIDLDNMWRVVYSQYPEVIIEMVKQVGRVDRHKCWIFKNIMITDSGAQILPDDQGVFWVVPGQKGLRIKNFNEDTEGYGAVPFLTLELDRQQANDLLFQVIKGLSKNFNSLGSALMLIGWMHANVYSNEIFRADGGFGSLMIWGTGGKGKSTVSRWIQQFFGMPDQICNSAIQQLKSAIGFQRCGSHYASLPLLLDEVRADELTGTYLGMIRSWYDRQSRVMAVKDSDMVKTLPVRANLMLSGEDLPADDATRQRCIMIRMPPVDPHTPEMMENYVFMNSNVHLFSNITYYWIMDSITGSKKSVLDGIRDFDRQLLRVGVSNRISKVWASAGYFANKMAQEMFPDFNFVEWVLSTCSQEQTQLVQDNTVNNFFSNMATLEARDPPKITGNHFMRDGNLVHIWYPAVYKEVADNVRGLRDTWSKNAILRSIKEEPFYVSDDRKLMLGLSGHRRTVLTLNLELAPEPLQSMVQYVPDSEKNK